MAAARLASAAVAAVLWAGGCGEDGADPPAADRGTAGADRTASDPGERGRRATGEGAGRDRELRRARCPAGLEECEVASGTILYVERVDPDGDGDAHFVLLGSQSVTAPGISVIDVRSDLRPEPLPGPGEWLSAAGPVHRGSYGQRQIEAVAVEIAPAR